MTHAIHFIASYTRLVHAALGCGRCECKFLMSWLPQQQESKTWQDIACSMAASIYDICYKECGFSTAVPFRPCSQMVTSARAFLCPALSPFFSLSLSPLSLAYPLSLFLYARTNAEHGFRYSIYLLYYYKSTNTHAAGGSVGLVQSLNFSGFEAVKRTLHPDPHTPAPLPVFWAAGCQKKKTHA